MSSSLANFDYDKRIDTLFSRLGGIYGHVWASAYQNERALAFAKKEWSETLQCFDSLILKDALLQIRVQKQYPPTLPQFYECCKAIKNRQTPCGIKDDSNKPRNMEVADKNIKAMFSLLKK
ncbi:TPA: Vir protein [Legionella pneumophila]